MALEILPEHLPTISAQLCVEQASLVSVLGAAEAAASPAAAACDIVSQINSICMQLYQPAFFPATTSPGVGELLHGAEVLVPVSADYDSMDIAGGTSVTCQGAGFVK